jgi:diguanylate cyclase (GGDEF)-like protein
MHLLRSLLLLIVPGFLFCAALYLQLRVVVPDAWQPLLDLFPYLAVAAALFFGWRFNRTRVLWTLILLLLVERALISTTPFGREFLLQTAPILVSLNLVIYGWWSERGLFTWHGLLRLVTLLLQIGAVVWVYSSLAGEVMAWLGRPLLNSALIADAPFSQITMLFILFSVIALLIRFCRKPDALEGSFCWVLGSAVAGFWWPEHFSFWGGVAAFLLMVAVVESSFKMAFNDELTGLPARRAMNEFLLKVGRRYTVAMVDVDHFKKVNDTHGHDVGDQVLRMVATCLRRVTGGGRAYRYGGEEFAVIFPSKDKERALPHLEELREAIARSGFMLRGRKRPKKKPENMPQKKSGTVKLQVTVSIGVASRDDKNTTPEQLIKAADQALYKAKKGGRNRVCSA